MVTRRWSGCLFTLWMVVLVGCAQAGRRLIEKEVDGIDNQYIVVYERTVNVHAKVEELNLGEDQLLFVYDDAYLKGFSVHQVTLADLDTLLLDTDIVYIEQDHSIHSDNFWEWLFGLASAADDEQDAIDWVPWGLDRINQDDLPLDNDAIHNGTGSGVDVFVLDSGIRLTHNEFKGSMVECVLNVMDASLCEDGYGHGSHVAATIAGQTYGVAKNVNLKIIKVLDSGGSGTIAGLLSGIDYVVNYMGEEAGSNPVVINTSLGGRTSQVINDAVAGAVEAGAVFVVSAGNNHENACEQSPASSNRAITVGGTGNDDEPGFYSNYGTCVDIFAPGSDIESAWYRSDSDTNLQSGTSMAVPHVAGVAALILEENPEFSPDQVWQQLNTTATLNTLSFPWPFLADHRDHGSPNKLLRIH